MKHWILLSFLFSPVVLAQHAVNPDGGGYAFEIPRHLPQPSSWVPATSFPLSNLDAGSQRSVDLAIHGFWLGGAETYLRNVMRRNPDQPMVPMLAALTETVFNSGDM